MNVLLVQIYDPNTDKECDRCGDVIARGEEHYHTENDEIILCATCALHTKP